MTGEVAPPTRAQIEAAVREIAAVFRAQRIVLFGSHASGEPTPDSDVDLLVVMPTNLPNIEQAVEIRRRVQFPFPVDLLVRSPEQLSERLARGDAFFEEVVAKGVVLYETDAPGPD